VSQGGSKRRRVHLNGATSRAVGESEFADGVLEREIPAAEEHTSVWVTADEQELEHQDGQPESVVIGRANHRSEVLPLKLRRRVVSHTHFTKVVSPAGRDLE